MALLNEKFGDYAEKLFHVHVGEPPRDRPPLWLSEAALKSMAKALRRCKEEGEPFVVAVGGHSAAAAHGNLPKEGTDRRLADPMPWWRSGIWNLCSLRLGWSWRCGSFRAGGVCFAFPSSSTLTKPPSRPPP
eukprot:scaffold301_cov243-Pinguiococcus_pyrenoidosus.AAC.171